MSKNSLACNSSLISHHSSLFIHRCFLEFVVVVILVEIFFFDHI
jgi:hypothetical protein